MKKKRKAWIWIVVLVLILGLGGVGQNAVYSGIVVRIGKNYLQRIIFVS